MKILYAIQGTGNGHVSRAREVIPHIRNHGELDVLISGIQSEVDVNYPVKYKLYGWSFMFGKKGGVDFWSTVKKMRNFRFFKDIYDFPVQNYDLIINDFEPISSWACKLKGKPCVAMSHQASFLSSKTPRPKQKNPFVEQIFKHYAPAQEFIGFHFERYDYFIHTPVIRGDIRRLQPEDKGHITVYHPAYDDQLLVKYFSRVPDIKFEVFSKHTKESYREGNVFVHPIQSENYTRSVETCHGLITAGGFEAPTEAIFLGKKVMVIPMIGQYEQHCNAVGAKHAGCKLLDEVNEHFPEKIKDWLEFSKPLHINYPDETADIVANLVKNHKKTVEI